MEGRVEKVRKKLKELRQINNLHSYLHWVKGFGTEKKGLSRLLIDLPTEMFYIVLDNKFFKNCLVILLACALGKLWLFYNFQNLKKWIFWKW